MRLVRLLPILLLSTAVLAQGPTRASYEIAATGTAQPCSAGVCTRSDPTAATEGMSLVPVHGYRLSICAASGQTLTGAGTMKAWVYNVKLGLWQRNKDLDQAVTESTKRCQAFTDFLVGAEYDARVVFAASSVGVSGGTGLDVAIEGY